MSLLPALPAQAETWYVRGSLGVEKTANARFFDADCASTNPPALFGCGTGADANPIGVHGNFGHGRTLELALGKRWSPLWRSDISLTGQSGLCPNYH